MAVKRRTPPRDIFTGSTRKYLIKIPRQHLNNNTGSHTQALEKKDVQTSQITRMQLYSRKSALYRERQTCIKQYLGTVR